MAAQVLGYDKPDPNQLYNLSDEQLEAVKKKLIELKPNVRKYWSTGGELTNLFQNHEVIVAMGWPLMTVDLRKLNYPIGETIPKENTTGWIDHLMITAASSHKEFAQAFLEYMVEPQTQKLVTDVTHYTPANPGDCTASHAECGKEPASRRSRRLHEADLFLAGRAATAEIHRDLERGKERAVSGPARHCERCERDCGRQDSAGSARRCQAFWRERSVEEFVARHCGGRISDAAWRERIRQNDLAASHRRIRAAYVRRNLDERRTARHRSPRTNAASTRSFSSTRCFRI